MNRPGSPSLFGDRLARSLTALGMTGYGFRFPIPFGPGFPAGANSTTSVAS